MLWPRSLSRQSLSGDGSAAIPVITTAHLCNSIYTIHHRSSLIMIELDDAQIYLYINQEMEYNSIIKHFKQSFKISRIVDFIPHSLHFPLNESVIASRFWFTAHFSISASRNNVRTITTSPVDFANKNYCVELSEQNTILWSHNWMNGRLLYICSSLSCLFARTQSNATASH